MARLIARSQINSGRPCRKIGATRFFFLSGKVNTGKAMSEYMKLYRRYEAECFQAQFILDEPERAKEFKRLEKVFAELQRRPDRPTERIMSPEESLRVAILTDCLVNNLPVVEANPIRDLDCNFKHIEDLRRFIATVDRNDLSPDVIRNLHRTAERLGIGIKLGELPFSQSQYVRDRITGQADRLGRWRTFVIDFMIDLKNAVDFAIVSATDPKLVNQDLQLGSQVEIPRLIGEKQAAESSETSGRQPNQSTIERLLAAYTNGTSMEFLRRLARVVEGCGTVDEKTTRMNEILSLSTLSASQIADLLGCSKQAVMKTTYWKNHRNGELAKRSEKRRQKMLDKGREYENLGSDG